MTAKARSKPKSGLQRMDAKTVVSDFIKSTVNYREVRCLTCQDADLRDVLAEFGRRKAAGETNMPWRQFWVQALQPLRPGLKYCTMLNHVRNCIGAKA